MVDNKLKSISEIREELRHIGIARYYYQGARRMILWFMQSEVYPQKEPKIEYHAKAKGIKISDKKWIDFHCYHLLKQALQDTRLLEALLLGEEIDQKFGCKIEKGKEYTTVKYYPKSQIKYLKIYQDYDTDAGE